LTVIGKTGMEQLPGDCTASGVHILSYFHPVVRKATGYNIIGDNFVRCEPIFTTSATLGVVGNITWILSKI